MTDLEIIKEMADEIDEAIPDCNFHEIPSAVESIVEAATRMSERIAELEKQFVSLAKFLNLCDYCKKEFATCDSQTNGIEWGTGKGNDNVVYCVAFEAGRDLYKEINELKAELAAAKPITCGECKLWHKFNCNFAYDDENLKENDFCSKGIHKEE